MKRLLALVPLVFAGSALGSTYLLRNPPEVGLALKGSIAQVSHGTRAASVWGALNSRQPSQTVPNVQFRRDYSGRKGKGAAYCGPYHGPRLDLQVKVCRAKDGTLWGLQMWRRLVPNYGGVTAPRELHVSHFTFPISEFVDLEWRTRYGAPVLYGRLVWRDHGVYGFCSNSTGVPCDTYGRLVFLDTYNSKLGPGWHRENSFLTQGPGQRGYSCGAPGCFAYSFSGRARDALGEKYRLTASGPGVTPIVRTVISGP